MRPLDERERDAMTERTKAQLLQAMDLQDKRIEGLQLQLKQKDNALYVMIEVGERNFCVGRKTVGTEYQYGFVCTCRNRHQAQTLVTMLNKGNKEND